MTALDKLIEAVEAGSVVIYDRETGLDNSELILVQKALEGSLDAALALHEALLTGWDWEVCNDMRDQTALVWPKGHSVKAINGHLEFVDWPTPARAWLLAILSAYRSVKA